MNPWALIEKQNKRNNIIQKDSEWIEFLIDYDRVHCSRHSAAVSGNGISDLGRGRLGGAIGRAREIRAARTAMDENMQPLREVLHQGRGGHCECPPGLPLHGHPRLHVCLQPVSLVWKIQRRRRRRRRQQEQQHKLVNICSLNVSIKPQSL